MLAGAGAHATNQHNFSGVLRLIGNDNLVESNEADYINMAVQYS